MFGKLIIGLLAKDDDLGCRSISSITFNASNMMKRFFFYWCCFLTVQSWAQQAQLDSLKALLPTTAANEQAALYLQLAKAALTVQPPQAITYTREGEALLAAQQLELKSELYRVRAKATLYLGQLGQAESLLDSAITIATDAGLSLESINDTRSELYYHGAISLLYEQPKQSLAYIEKILTLIAPDNHPQLGIAYNIQAGAYATLLEYDSALVALDSSFYHLERMEDTLLAQSQMASIYSNKAAILTNQRRYQQAAELFYKAIDIYDALGLSKEKSNTLNNLSGIYTYLDDSKTAIEYCKQAIVLERSKEVVDTADLYGSYYNLAIMYGNDGQQDTALMLFDQIIPYYQAHQMYNRLALCYIQKSFGYDELGELSKALYYCQQAADLQKHFSTLYILRELREMQAKLYRKTGDLERSQQLYRLLIDSTSYPDPFYKIQSLKGGIKTAVLAKDFELVYQYMQQKEVLEDSLAAINSENIIRDLEVQYQTREVQQQNELLQQAQTFAVAEATQNRRLLYLAIGAAILLIGLLLLLLQYRTIKSAVQNKELKFQLLRNQMNPHFLFNVLGAIQSFIYTSKPVQAADFLSSFAELVRAILDHSNKEYITVAKEVEWLENYVALQALRFGKNLQYTIEVDPQLKQQEFLIPPMLIQPMIENALEHGFKDIDYQGHLTIKMVRLDQSIEILIEDNGVGFDPSNPTSSTTEYTSHATRITKERIALINRKHSEKISFTTRSAPQEGTTVRFHLPLYT